MMMMVMMMMMKGQQISQREVERESEVQADLTKDLPAMVDAFARHATYIENRTTDLSQSQGVREADLTKYSPVSANTSRSQGFSPIDLLDRVGKGLFSAELRVHICVP